MSRKRIVVAALVVLAILVLGCWYSVGRGAYSVVYFTSGEVYVGKLRTFPHMVLTDSYILQVIKDPKDESKSNFQLQPISEALWAPKRLYLSRKNVIFYGPLVADSKIGQALVEKAKK